jgi:hypothetical protein
VRHLPLPLAQLARERQEVNDESRRRCMQAPRYTASLTRQRRPLKRCCTLILSSCTSISMARPSGLASGEEPPDMWLICDSTPTGQQRKTASTIQPVSGAPPGEQAECDICMAANSTPKGLPKSRGPLA